MYAGSATWTVLCVILGVSEGAGKYMTGFKTVAAMVDAMVDSMGITVPVALHLDHGTYEGCKACVEAGFSSIMFDGSHYSIEENVAKTKELVALAHSKGLSIEAEVGSIGGVEDGVVGAGEIADPEECAKITALGIDFLAAGIGNIHGVYPANWKGLDFEALDRIHKATNNIPLVLHVLICITGGNTGLGFCNMTDEQIADFVFQLKYVVETYKLDGVNYFDIEASYGKDGMPGVNPASYAKLIKATKEALGDGKLVTVACDAESTDLLATAHDGIEAGKYIDYAWSGIFDEVVDAYTDGAKLKPIAGLEQSKYGGALLKTHNTQESAQLNPILTPAVKSLYRETQSGNVFAFWDMPTNSAGYEEGPKSAFNIVADAVTDWDWEYDGMILLINVTWDDRNYGNFTKDW